MSNMSYPSLPESPTEAPQAGATPRVEVIVPEHIRNDMIRVAQFVLKQLKKGENPEDVWEDISSNEKISADMVYFRAMFYKVYDAIVPSSVRAKIDATLDAEMAELIDNASPPASAPSAAPASAPPAPPVPMRPAAPAPPAPQVTRHPQGASRLRRTQGVSPGPRTSSLVGSDPSNIHGDGTSSTSMSTEMTNDTSLHTDRAVLHNWADAVGPTVHGCSTALGMIGPGTTGLLGVLSLFGIVSYFFVFNNLGHWTITFLKAFATAFACFMISRKEWQDGKK